MGSGLLGPSGDTNTTTTNNNLSAQINPQLTLTGSAPGTLGLAVSPNFQQVHLGGGSLSLESNPSSYYAPISITSTGDVTGDTALSAIQGIAKADQQTLQATSTGTPSSAAGGLSTLFSGNTVYYALGAIVILFLAHSKKG